MSWLRAMMTRRSRRRETDCSPELEEARQEKIRAEKMLRKVRGETSEILSAAERLKSLGMENDFASRLRQALGGDP